MSSSTAPNEDRGEVVKFEGSENKPTKELEQTRWRRFLNFFFPWTRKSALAVRHAGELGLSYTHATLSNRQAQARKTAEEAAAIAASRDRVMQETVFAVNQEISRIFSDENIPDSVKQLQLANLIASNPQLADQLDRIDSISKTLKAKHGVSFEVERSEPKSISAESGAIPHQAEKPAPIPNPAGKADVAPLQNVIIDESKLPKSGKGYVKIDLTKPPEEIDICSKEEIENLNKSSPN